MHQDSHLTSPRHRALAISAAAAAATALWVESRARRAERRNPPLGKLMHIDGVRLHHVIRGEGPPVVLVHGNTVTLQDFEASGLIDRLARDHRVIAFDRPGFGHSSRPRDRLWTPSRQADLLHRACVALGVEEPVVLGHSMGAMVAMAMALDHPAHVRGLVLVGGYYYPGLRVDALLTSPVALPVLGDVMRYTVTALSARAMLGRMVKAMFAPNEVPAGFMSIVPRELMLRPIQLRANAEDAAFMIPQARASSRRHGELRLPVTVIAGADDKVVDVADHAQRLHDELANSRLVIVPHTGHMAHYVAHDAIADAVDRALEFGSRSPSLRGSVDAASPASHPVPRTEPAP